MAEDQFEYVVAGGHFVSSSKRHFLGFKRLASSGEDHIDK